MERKEEINYSLELPKNFWTRIGMDLPLNVLFSSLVFFLLYQRELNFALILSIVSFLTQLSRSYISNKFYIYEIKLNRETYQFSYLDKNLKNSISDTPENFEIKKGRILARNTSPYLEIKYNNDLVIKQFCNKKWNQAQIDEIVFYHTGKINNSFMHRLYKIVNDNLK